jgi:hypothetical protein
MIHLNSTEKETAQLNVIDIKEWVTHYKKLWVDDSLDDASHISLDRVCVDMIDINELEEALKYSKNRKATGEDGLNLELFKYSSILFKFRFLHLINMCWKTCSIPEDWKKAKVISLFKKGERSNVNNYRGISLLSTAYKVYAKIVNNRLRKISEVIILEDQAGFRTGRSCIDDVFTLKQIISKRAEYNLETHLAFIDYVKAFDRVRRSQLWDVMKRRGIPDHITNVVRSLYCGTKIVIVSGNTKSEEVPTN